MQSVYEHNIIEEDGYRFAIVIDLADENSEIVATSVTNNIVNVADELGVDYIVYRDSMLQWDFWDRKNGFGTLSEDGEACMDVYRAIARAQERYLPQAEKQPA